MVKSTIRVLFAALVLAACESSATAPGEVSMSVVSGADQVGGLGAPLARPVVVRVVDAAGNGVSGRRVTWHVGAGGGSTDSTVTTTDASGNASVRWTLGIDTGTQLLIASATNASISVRATGQFQFRSVAAGFGHTCAIATTGEAYCWGLNTSGQLGDGTELPRSTPVLVQGGKHFLSISAGWGQTCGIALGQEAYCWGDNAAGQLGAGISFNRWHGPIAVAGSNRFVNIAAGFVHTCAIGGDSLAYCWGDNTMLQLGTSGGPRNIPVAVSSIVKFQSVSAGEFHSCAVASGGAAYCWGSNSDGQLGIGAPYGESRGTPTHILANATFTQIAAGVRHTCATGAQLYCWGRNALGETGFPPLWSDISPHLVPAPHFDVVSGGNVTSCGANETGAWCWGGDATHSSVTPEQIFTGPVSALSVGFNHACLVSLGDVYCWGSNAYGQLGRSGIAGSRDPVKVTRPK